MVSEQKLAFVIGTPELIWDAGIMIKEFLGRDDALGKMNTSLNSRPQQSGILRIIPSRTAFWMRTALNLTSRIPNRWLLFSRTSRSYRSN